MRIIEYSTDEFDKATAQVEQLVKDYEMHFGQSVSGIRNFAEEAVRIVIDTVDVKQSTVPEGREMTDAD